MESDADFLSRYWEELNWDTDDADFDRLFTLARRGAAAGELLEALREIDERHIPDQPSALDIDEADYIMRQYAELRRIARAAIAQFEATAATQETRND